MNNDEERRKKVQMIGVFVTIPFVLAVPPIIGWAIGSWLDGHFNTDPYLMFIFIVLGLIAGVREFIRLIKRYGNGN